MISLFALAFAAITLSFDKSTIKYPAAGRDSFSADWIAGNGGNVKRIGAESRLAMLGTIDATISRLLFPTLGNYGGARNANSSRLSSADWNEQVLMESEYFWTEPMMIDSDGWPYQLMNLSLNVDGEVTHYGYRFNVAERRDFSKAQRRIEEINALIDCYVLGDVGYSDEYCETIFRNGLCGEGFWLVPANVKGAGLEIPVCQWTEKFHDFNPFAGHYALAIGELSKRGLGGSWRGARMGAPESFYYEFWHQDFWNIADALKGSPNWDGVDPLDVMSFVLGSVYAAGETNESIRAAKQVSVADLLAAHSDGIDFTSFTNRPTNRIWKERIAFANAYLAACRTKAIPLPRTMPVVFHVGSNTLSSVGTVWKSPFHHFQREEYSGNLSAKLRMTMDLGEGESFGINSDDGMVPLDLGSFKTESFTATNDYAISTNWAENLTCAWTEEDAKITVGGDVVQPVRFSDFGVTADEIYAQHGSEWTTLFLSYNVDPDNPYKVALIMRDGAYQVGLSVGPEVSTNWTGYIDLVYNGNVRGVECLGVGEAVEGYSFAGDKTQEELAEYSLDKTILPPQLNPISESLIGGITLNYVDVLGISTNRAEVGGVAGGGFWVPGACFDRGDPGQPETFTPKDTWIYLRTEKLERKPATKSEMDAYMVAMYDEAVGQLPVAYGLAAGLGDVSPPNRAASQISEGVLQRVAQKIISGQGGVKMQPQAPAILTPNLRVRATSEDKLEVAGGEDQVVASFSFRIALTKSASGDDAPLRASCAVGFWRQPHAIVEWDFPAMGFSGE